MKWFTLKKTEVPVSNETKQIDAVQLWRVTWYSRHGCYSGDLSKEFEAFTSREAADTFADSLRAAFKLIRHTSATEVNVEKQS